MPGCAPRPAEPEARRRRANDRHSGGRPHRLAMVADPQDTPPYRETDVSTAEAGQNTAPPDLTSRPPRYRDFGEISGLRPDRVGGSRCAASYNLTWLDLT